MDLHRQTRRGVPGDVVVDDLDARVVGFEPDGHVAGRGEQGDVSAGRVVVPEGAVGEIEWMERAVLLGEEDEIVTVQMDRVGDADESPVFQGLLIGALSRRDDQIDPIVLGVVFCYQGLVGIGKIRGPVVILDVVDGWVAKLQPHG